jgi:hypothetical protein
MVLGNGISALSAPSFKQPPQTAPVTIGYPAGFSAVVSGSGSVTYSVQKGGTTVVTGIAACVDDWRTAAAGTAHVLAIKKDGSLWAWGDNSSGQLGSSDPATYSTYPIRIGTGTTWKAVSARGGISAAVKTDGTFWIWGSGFTATPTQYGSGTTWTSASLGDISVMLLAASGSLYEMPYSTKSPARVGTATDWASISAGFMMMSAIKTDGTLWNRPLNTTSSWSAFAGQSRVSGSTNPIGTAATFSYPNSIASESGTLYVGDSNGIRKITASGSVTTLSNQVSSPSGITVSGGTVFAVSGRTIKKITSSGVVSTFAGNDNWGEPNSADGTGTAARFNYPNGIAATSGGTLYVADTNNHTIRKITSAGVVSTVAGIAGLRWTTDDGLGVATLDSPKNLCCDASGNLYFFTSGNTLRKLTTAGQVFKVAGDSSVNNQMATDGLGVAARFSYPNGLTADAAGNLYVGDSNRIRKVTPLGQVTTLAGAGGVEWEQGSVNGAGDVAKFYQPTGLTSVSGTLYVVDPIDQTIRKGVLTIPQVSANDSQGGFVKIDGTNQWSKISAGNGYALGLKTDGSIYAWGQANLSYWPSPFVASGSYHTTPVRLGADSSDYNDIAAGDLALTTCKTTGNIRRLTENSDENYTINTSAQAGSAIIAWSSMAAPSHDTATESALLLDASGVLWSWGRSWGRNDLGQRGNYTQNDFNYYTGYIGGFSDPVQVGVDPAWGLSSPVQGIPLGATTQSASRSNLGAYSLSVTDLAGATTTASFALVAWPTAPSPVRAVASGSFSLSATVDAGSGSASPTYQWLRNGSTVSGANQPTLSVNSASSSQSGVYELRVGVGSAQALSAPVVVTVDSTNVLSARNSLSAGNYVAASNYLSAAVSASSSDGTAQILRSVLDLYNLWSDPTTTTVLSNLGISGSADPKNLSLIFSESGFPVGAVSSSVRNWLLNTLYPKLKAADDNLATIVDFAFIASIRPQDLRAGATGDDIYVDYGDVAFLRAGVNMLMAWVKWIETQNTDVDLRGLQMDRRNGRLSMETLLTTANKYASLLSASTSANAAQTEFVSRFKGALIQYQSFSNFANPTTAASNTRRYSDLCAIKLETSQDRTDEKKIRSAVDKTQTSLSASNAMAGRQVYSLGDGETITLSPWVFVNHTPGWRSDLPQFTKNRYKGGTLNRTLVSQFAPTVLSADLDDIENQLTAAEPKITAVLRTRDDSSPPELDISGTLTSLNSTDGWVTIEGLARDASGVKGVTLTATCGTSVDSYDAVLEAGTLAGGWRKWSVQVALPSGFTGSTVSVGINAEDVYGGITETALTKSFSINRLVPFSLLSSGSGTVTCSPSPDDNGFVPMGSRITITAKPASGSVLRRMETVIDGQPQALTTARPTSQTLIVRGETTVSVIFEPNPYVLIGGRNKTAYSVLEPSSSVSGCFVDGVFPMTSLQVSVTSLGSFSGRLQIGRSAYSVAGRFDADGFYSATIAGRIPCLNWSVVSSLGSAATDSTRLPTCSALPISLQLWVDTTEGIDSPKLRASVAEGFGTNLGGTLLSAGSLDYLGAPLFTGTFNKQGSSNAPGIQNPGGWISYGLPSSSATQTGDGTGTSLPGSGGYYSIAARKSGTATVLGMLPNGERFTSTAWLLDQSESDQVSSASVRLLTAVGTNGAFGFVAGLSTPVDQMSGNSYQWARREAWYPGNRGPVFETGNIYSAGLGFHPAPIAVFAREWSSQARPLVPTLSGDMQVNLSPPGGSLTQAFSIKSESGKISASLFNSALLKSVKLNLSLSTGIMTGSMQLPSGKLLSLQGVFIQNSLNLSGVWITPDGRRFISDRSPITNSGDSW